ncbi:hypothetical protein WAI453_004360 [Rhynchosporium graminicola]
MTGVLSAAVAAAVARKLADNYGRRLAYITLHVTYSISFLFILTDDIGILFIGRILGGTATTLLCTVFESWMVAEFIKVFPAEPETTVSGSFGTMTTLSIAVAMS